MDKFGPETKVRFECRQCNKIEIIKFGDIPTTPKGTFIIPLTAQCIECLEVISCEIRDEDQD